MRRLTPEQASALRKPVSQTDSTAFGLMHISVPKHSEHFCARNGTLISWCQARARLGGDNLLDPDLGVAQ